MTRSASYTTLTDATELSPERVGGSDEEGAQLLQRDASAVDRRAARSDQHSQRFASATDARGRLQVAAECGTSGTRRVDRVGLGMRATVASESVHLEHPLATI